MSQFYSISDTISQSVSATGSSPIPHVQAGDRVEFGQYPQGRKGEVLPLIWRVLAVENGHALLITDRLIDHARFNKYFARVVWEYSSLRRWLNNDFMDKAFNAGEQARIATALNQNDRIPHIRYYKDGPTQDRIFLLSKEEVRRYFPSDEDRTAYTTDYAGKGADAWWLRSSGTPSYLWISLVNRQGGVNETGTLAYFKRAGLRPALWLNLEG